MRLSHRVKLLVTLVLIVMSASTAQAGQEQPATAPAREETVVRTYNVSDLMRVAVDYPLDSKIVPPTGFGGNRGTESGNVSGQNLFGGLIQHKPAPQETLDPLSKLIVDLIDAESWRENGGDTGMIRTFNSLLVITQTADRHRRIEELLQAIRQSSGPSQVVAVRATWVTLTGDVPQPGTVITNEWLAKQKLYCEGRTVCFSGQTVHVTSGRGRTVVEDINPIVGTSSVAFDPTTSLVQSGVSLQVSPQFVPGAESAILDLQSYATEWDAPPSAASISGVVATQPTGGTETSTGLDRLNVVAQEMKTTLRVPLGKKTVVGGMTLDPSAGEAQGRQLCLVVELTAVK